MKRLLLLLLSLCLLLPLCACGDLEPMEELTALKDMLMQRYTIT